MARRSIPKPRILKFLTSAIRPAPKVHTDRTAEEWIEGGWPVGVSSSWVTAIRYDRERLELFVGFKDGVTCKYLDVDEITAQDMFNASSMGVFVHRRLMGFFVYVLV